LTPFCTAPGSVFVPSLFTPAAVGAPEFEALPAEGMLEPEPVPEVMPPEAPPLVPPFVELPPAVGAPDMEPPPALPPELCASAKVLVSANAVARTIVFIFMVISSRVGVQM
jgi:hypothetical protein